VLNRGDFAWLTVLCGFSSLLILPSTHQVFVSATQGHPYIMGFIKFAILATMGELLAIRIVSGRWNKTIGMVYKAILWGFFGMSIVLMFEIYLNGVNGAVTKGLLFAGEGAVRTILSAFYVSALMNITFAPAFMAVHRMTDLYVDRMCEGQGERLTLSTIITIIDWNGFIQFVVLKTIPFFWIPAHTVTFMLPPEYRVLAAAYLSIALGAILSYARRRQVEQRF
jgi:hypothetical protein